MPANEVFEANAPKTTKELIEMVASELEAMQMLVPVGRETPLAFVCSIGCPLVDWALELLPRAGSGSPHSTENERMLLHQLRGTLHALADIY